MNLTGKKKMERSRTLEVGLGSLISTLEFVF